MPDEVSEEQIDDPFWSVVRRRHPDIDIVLLPPQHPAPQAPQLPPRAPEAFAQEHIGETDRLWAALVGHGMPRSDARWIPGPAVDSVRHSVTLTLGDVDEGIALGHLRGAAERLTADGWRVFLPPTGTPRVMADRDGELGDAHLLFGHAPANRNLFLRLESAGVPVGERIAYELLGGAA
ncbi:hypothetical protein Q9R19_03265 [Microbacterium sp. ARD32]|uniref:hypothetical protein n=1 Tax=Microbacterium sp. ARD32 TaxID=2962577 RepID=UPI002881C1AF|nr:hypothetical protein [Microbacterium sp. ARD32]MDT0156639.1 hypothetical protein [Microbacterium sp. ARD32]